MKDNEEFLKKQEYYVEQLKKKNLEDIDKRKRPV